MVKTTILLTNEQHNFLRSLSFTSKKSISEILRGYIDQFSKLAEKYTPTNGTYKPTVTSELPVAKPSTQQKSPFSNYKNKGSIPFA